MRSGAVTSLGMTAHPGTAAEQPIPASGTLAIPGEGEVRVWWASTRVPTSTVEALRADLDDETMGRVNAMVRDADRTRGILAHGLLRRLVSAYTGQEPAAVTLTRACASCGATDHGKPMLLARGGGGRPPLQFNLAHSGEIVAVALAGPSTPIGVDVESLQEDFDWAPTRRHVFTDDEWDTTCADADPSAARFALWARKEAAAKATGHGLAIDLVRVPISREPHGDGARRGRLQATERAYELLVTDVVTAPGTAAAVATVGTGRAPIVRVARAALVTE